MTESSIDKLKREAFAMSEAYRQNPYSPAMRMAYANGVRTMAALVSACANAAEQLLEELPEGSTAHTVIAGYADGLHHIVESADDLIPPGYEY